MAGFSRNENESMSNDPFEEFEFRPINEGLGFHRKQKAQSSGAQFDSGFTTTRTLPRTENPPTFTTPKPQSSSSSTMFTTPLPRHENTSRTAFNIPSIEDDSIAKAQTAVNEILKNLNQKRQMDFVNETEKHKMDLKKSKPIFFAATLDGMLISAAFLLSMIIMLTVTKIDLFLNLSRSETASPIYIATLGLFMSVTFVYMIVNRTFLGYTPGEWAFDQRCGTPAQMQSLTYVPRLALRTIIVMATGFVISPLLSYLFNKDVAGQMTGVILFRKPNA